MYSFKLDGVLLPVTPSKIDFQIKNQNKTMTLLDEGEINILKHAGLTEISFTALLPRVKYTFAVYEGEQYGARYYLDKLEELKISRKAFNFKISRSMPGQELSETNMLVSLEDYAFTEDSKNGFDIEVKIKLKQYREYATKIVDEYVINGAMMAAIKNVRSTVTAPKVETYTVQKGDTLWAIAKKFLGDGAKCWNLAKLNNISNPNSLKIGQVIKIEDVTASYPAQPAKDINNAKYIEDTFGYPGKIAGDTTNKLNAENTIKQSVKDALFASTPYKLYNTPYVSLDELSDTPKFTKKGGLTGVYGGSTEIISDSAVKITMTKSGLQPVKPRQEWSQYPLEKK